VIADTFGGLVEPVEVDPDLETPRPRRGVNTGRQRPFHLQSTYASDATSVAIR
jgi:hypothetical protein